MNFKIFDFSFAILDSLSLSLSLRRFIFHNFPFANCKLLI